MKDLSLRFRIFLFFCLIGLGGCVLALLGLWLGYRQLGAPQALSAFVTAGIFTAFGLLALSAFIWRLFDENVAKPIERLAAQFRVRANADVDAGFDAEAARFLGDLAPAALAINERLGASSRALAETVAQETARLEKQRNQLLRILSDLPVAVIMATQDHQIVLYDGQAAALMEREAPARLKGSVFDYLEETALRELLDGMAADGSARRDVAIKGRSGTLYAGHLRVFGDGSGYTLMLEALEPGAARPLVYDFDLFDRAAPSDVSEASLRDLTFVVFDSETTGLDPEKDEVVQIGAVRVVNGRIIRAETFDRLVNPGRPIPPGATKVHHISDAMVADAPAFEAVRADFHAFARGAVLVAHNAPFDMAFLHRLSGPDAPVFDNPILDTVHLSAIVFGGSEEHTLDAISERLGIRIQPDERHTGLGDAIATAEVLVALMPILDARGLSRFGQIRAEMQKHARILKVQD
jgi:DNA polymerase-3 subunit epsilon